MELKKLLEDNREAILNLSRQKNRDLSGTLSASALLDKGLPEFFEQLISVLEQQLSAHPYKSMLLAAATHGKELLRLGYTLSQVVHAYGAMCQAITEIATRKNARITSDEFNILNGCLDVAIAAAVSEFQFRSNEATEEREVKHLGALAHELRNALSSATTAQEMIKAGLVGTRGSTANVLDASLEHMRRLIDRSLTEVRMRADSDLYLEKFFLLGLFDQITITADIDARKKDQTLFSEVDPKIEINGDRQLIFSAVANLIQNAIKYTKRGGKIDLKGQCADSKVVIEVQDECGGLEAEQLNRLFLPFTQGSEDRSGLGLGLNIVQRAVQLNKGTVTVQNNPGLGCKFTIIIPQILVADASAKNAVRGTDSIQPDFSKK